MKALVTGCCGFIGSNLVDRLLIDNFQVIGVDNLSTGQIRFIKEALNNINFQFYQIDLLDLNKLSSLLIDCDIVFHFAANADIKDGLSDSRRDLEQNTIVTYNVLEAMRLNGVKKIVFSSTGSVYGEANQIPTPEDACFPIQTSLYGASKVACESMIQAWCEGYGFQSWIFRFVSILGERYTHGHVFDFYKKILVDSSSLHVLGNGEQKKSYLYIKDCLDAILFCINNSFNKINVFNLGTNEFCSVKESIKIITKNLNVSPDLIFSGGNKGWIGDNPFIFLDCTKINKLGWFPRYSINDGIIKTIEYLKNNKWVLESRI